MILNHSTFLAVGLLGLGASLKCAYSVFLKGDIKSAGSFVSTLYLTIIFFILLDADFPYHAGNFIVVGIALSFVDKIIVFINDLTRRVVKTQSYKNFIRRIRGIL